MEVYSDLTRCLPFGKEAIIAEFFGLEASVEGDASIINSALFYYYRSPLVCSVEVFCLILSSSRASELERSKDVGYSIYYERWCAAAAATLSG